MSDEDHYARGPRRSTGPGTDEVWSEVWHLRCPLCRAEPGDKCRNPITGKPRHTPCLARFNPSRVPNPGRQVIVSDETHQKSEHCGRCNVTVEATGVRHLNGDSQDNRPSNLKWGTRSENQFDSVRHGTKHTAARTECPSGHAYTPENTYRHPKTGWRQCQKCRARHRAASRDRNAA